MSVNPPDAWTPVVGTWGTDCDRSTSVVLNGGASLWLKNTAVATKVQTALIPYSSMFTEGLLVRAIFQADSVTAGNTIALRVLEYDASLTLISNTLAFGGLVASVNTWQKNQLLAGGHLPNGGYVALSIEKAANAYNVYVDSFVATLARPVFSANNGGTDSVGFGYPVQSIPASAWTTVRFEDPFGGPQPGVGILRLDDYSFKIYNGGQWNFDAQVSLAGLTAGTKVQLKMINLAGGDVLGAVTRYAYGGDETFNLTGVSTVSVNGTAYRNYYIQVWHNDAGARNVLGDLSTGQSATRWNAWLLS